MSDNNNLEILVQTRLDQSSSAINQLNTDLESISKKLKSLSLSLKIDAGGVDQSTLSNLQRQISEIQRTLQQCQLERYLI